MIKIIENNFFSINHIFIDLSMSDDKIDLFDDEEVLAAGERWDPLGEEKEKDENVSDETNLNAVLQ